MVDCFLLTLYPITLLRSFIVNSSRHFYYRFTGIFYVDTHICEEEHFYFFFSNIYAFFLYFFFWTMPWLRLSTCSQIRMMSEHPCLTPDPKEKTFNPLPLNMIQVVYNDDDDDFVAALCQI